LSALLLRDEPGTTPMEYRRGVPEIRFRKGAFAWPDGRLLVAGVMSAP